MVNWFGHDKETERILSDRISEIEEKLNRLHEKTLLDELTIKHQQEKIKELQESIGYETLQHRKN